MSPSESRTTCVCVKMVLFLWESRWHTSDMLQFCCACVCLCVLLFFFFCCLLYIWTCVFNAYNPTVHHIHLSFIENCSDFFHWKFHRLFLNALLNYATCYIEPTNKTKKKNNFIYTYLTNNRTKNFFFIYLTTTTNNNVWNALSFIHSANKYQIHIYKESLSKWCNLFRQHNYKMLHILFFLFVIFT